MYEESTTKIVTNGDSSHCSCEPCDAKRCFFKSRADPGPSTSLNKCIFTDDHHDVQEDTKTKTYDKINTIPTISRNSVGNESAGFTQTIYIDSLLTSESNTTSHKVDDESKGSETEIDSFFKYLVDTPLPTNANLSETPHKFGKITDHDPDASSSLLSDEDATVKLNSLIRNLYDTPLNKSTLYRRRRDIKKPKYSKEFVKTLGRALKDTYEKDKYFQEVLEYVNYLERTGGMPQFALKSKGRPIAEIFEKIDAAYKSCNCNPCECIDNVNSVPAPGIVNNDPCRSNKKSSSPACDCTKFDEIIQIVNPENDYRKYEAGNVVIIKATDDERTNAVCKCKTCHCVECKTAWCKKEEIFPCHLSNSGQHHVTVDDSDNLQKKLPELKTTLLTTAKNKKQDQTRSNIETSPTTMQQKRSMCNATSLSLSQNESRKTIPYGSDGVHHAVLKAREVSEQLAKISDVLDMANKKIDAVSEKWKNFSTSNLNIGLKDTNLTQKHLIIASHSKDNLIKENLIRKVAEKHSMDKKKKQVFIPGDKSVLREKQNNKEKEQGREFLKTFINDMIDKNLTRSIQELEMRPHNKYKELIKGDSKTMKGAYHQYTLKSRSGSEIVLKVEHHDINDDKRMKNLEKLLRDSPPTTAPQTDNNVYKSSDVNTANDRLKKIPLILEKLLQTLDDIHDVTTN